MRDTATKAAGTPGECSAAFAERKATLAAPVQRWESSGRHAERACYLVTGAQGQLGGEICRRLGAAAVGLDLPEFDLARGDSALETLERFRPRAVINAAAYVLVDRAEQEPERCRQTNIEGVARLAAACRRLDAALVQVSTDYVFGRDAGRRTPYRETDEAGPLGVYGQSKLDGERAAAEWEKHVIVRTCGLYGDPGPRSAGNFVETMLRLADSPGELRLVDDQRCTPSYVGHVARAILFLLEVGASGIYHVVNGGSTTWHDFAAEIFRLSGKSVPMRRITTAEYGAAARRPLYSVLDTGKYHALAGRPEMPSWQQALAEYLQTRSACGQARFRAA